MVTAAPQAAPITLVSHFTDEETKCVGLKEFPKVTELQEEELGQGYPIALLSSHLCVSTMRTAVLETGSQQTLNFGLLNKLTDE